MVKYVYILRLEVQSCITIFSNILYFNKQIYCTVLYCTTATSGHTYVISNIKNVCENFCKNVDSKKILGTRFPASEVLPALVRSVRKDILLNTNTIKHINDT